MHRAVYSGIARCAIFLLLISSPYSGLVACGGTSAPVRAASSAEPRREKVSRDLLERAGGPSAASDQLDVVVRFRDKPSAAAEALLGQCGATTKGDFGNLNARAVHMPAGAITALASLDDVLFVSPDREVHSLGHITATTGADLVRSGSGVSGSELDGSGVGSQCWIPDCIWVTLLSWIVPED